MSNHQQQQDQETMVPMDSHKNPNLETTNNHHYVLPSPSSSSQDFKWVTCHQQNTHISKETHEDEGLIFKNAYEVIKKPNFPSYSPSSALAAEEGNTIPPPPPPPPPPPRTQDFKKTHDQQDVNVTKKRNENEDGFTIKNTNFLSCSSPTAGEGHTIPPPPPPPSPSPSPSPQDSKKTHHPQNIHVTKRINENEDGSIIKNTTFLSCSSPAAGEGCTMPPPPPPPPPPPTQDFKKTHDGCSTNATKKINENEGGLITIKNTNHNSISCCLPVAGEAVAVEEESGRDRLKKHRIEMAGRVRIPDTWGHEDLLKDWIDCTIFDSSLGNNSIMSARAALVQERRSTLRIQNQW